MIIYNFQCVMVFVKWHLTKVYVLGRFILRVKRYLARVYVMVCFYSACQVVLDKSINDSFEYNYEFVIKHVK